MSAGKIIIGGIAFVGIAILFSSFVSSDTKKKLKGTGVKGPDDTPPLSPDVKTNVTLPDIPPAERSEGASRIYNTLLLSVKRGDKVYSKYNRVYLHTKPIGNLRTIVNYTNPIKKFEEVGEYEGESAEKGWSKVYARGRSNPYLFVRTESITNTKTV